MAKLAFRKLDDHCPLFRGPIALHVVLALGVGAALYTEEHGHIVTGMSNQIVWGTPHVFAVFLIVAASGALNVASISSVFNRLAYKPYARLSGILAVSLLAGGLMVLRLTVIAMLQTFNGLGPGGDEKAKEHAGSRPSRRGASSLPRARTLGSPAEQRG